MAGQPGQQPLHVSLKAAVASAGVQLAQIHHDKAPPALKRFRQMGRLGHVGKEKSLDEIVIQRRIVGLLQHQLHQFDHFPILLLLLVQQHADHLRETLMGAPQLVVDLLLL